MTDAKRNHATWFGNSSARLTIELDQRHIDLRKTVGTFFKKSRLSEMAQNRKN
jgi:hypothetical protein